MNIAEVHEKAHNTWTKTTDTSTLPVPNTLSRTRTRKHALG